MRKHRFKIVRKIVENDRKSSLGAVLEHFGDLLGAKMVQKLRQDLENIKNIRFWGRPGGPKWSPPQKKPLKYG